MHIVRRYKKLDWWDFLTVIDQELEKMPAKETYIDLIDELRMRKIESISEGATFKMKAPSKDILERFKNRMSEDQSFASDEDLTEITQLVDEVVK
jgi:hypothetical protein